MHNGYCTFPIGSSYTWVNISKTGSQIVTKFSGFWGSPVDLKSVKISGCDSGILREGWKKKFDPLNLPPRGSWDPQIFFPLGSTESTLLPNFTLLRQKLGSWGRGKFLFFLNSNLQHEVWQRHALGPIIVFISSYMGRNLLKKIEDRILNFFPVLEIWPPKLYQFFGKFLPKIHVGLVWGI